ncbi:MAG: hypothetical protein JW706_04325 [Opitutales bacterium]|nr:hypothetical protein [Opitutales bacterium]
MKFDSYSAYDPSVTSQSLPAFLTVWPGLSLFHKDLVLIEGLVPLCICKHPIGGDILPRHVTMDVDFGIALGASSALYGTIATDLSGMGFRLKDPSKARYVTNSKGHELFIDFLVESTGDNPGTMMVDDIIASGLPGIQRALDTARHVTLEGQDLFGGNQQTTARVCEVGPFLALKLRAFGSRQQGKDAFDILYTLKHYDRGFDAALEGFATEVDAGNPACPDALKALRDNFASEQAPGPTRAAHFLLGAPYRNGSKDEQLKRTLLKQEMVNTASALRNAAQ